MTEATHPTPGKPLDQDSVKLLLPRDVLLCVNPHTQAHKVGKKYVFEERTHNKPGEGNDIRLKGSRLSTWSGVFTFVSRPTPVGGDQEPQPSPAASGWRPIETAPKDGTRFLAFGWWKPSWTNPEPNVAVMWRYDADTYCEGIGGKATHWMPLPPAPTPTQGDNHDQ